MLAPNAHTGASVAVHASVNLCHHTFQARLHAHGSAIPSTLGAMHRVRTADTCKAVGMSIQASMPCVLKGRECSEGVIASVLGEGLVRVTAKQQRCGRGMPAGLEGGRRCQGHSGRSQRRKGAITDEVAKTKQNQRSGENRQWAIMAISSTSIAHVILTHPHTTARVRSSDREYRGVAAMR